MFFNPTINPNLVPMTGELGDGYSDCHKDAFGCRPRKPEPTNPIERAIEWDAISQWAAEDMRIEKLRTEVARFDFSRRMQYFARREGLSQKEAFKMAIRVCKMRPYPNDELPSWQDVENDISWYGWGFIAMDCGLPNSDGKQLQEWWEGLNA